MTKIKHTVRIRSNDETGCEHCITLFAVEDWAKAVNHYIEKHGYTLIHVGTETDHDSEGRPCHYTVAVLGKFGPVKEQQQSITP
jgi:hypothetical protein